MKAIKRLVWAGAAVGISLGTAVMLGGWLSWSGND